MNQSKHFLIFLICGFLSACVQKDVVLGSVNPQNKNTFVQVSADTEFIVITKINGKVINGNRGLINPTKYLVKPGNTIVEAHFLRHKSQIIKSCFNFKSGQHYQVRPNWYGTSPLLIASIANNMVYGKIANNCL